MSIKNFMFALHSIKYCAGLETKKYCIEKVLAKHGRKH